MRTMILNNAEKKGWDRKLINILILPRYKWLRHLVLFALAMAVTFGDMDFSDKGYVLTKCIASFLGIMVPIYLNVFVLVPRYLLRNKFTTYIIWIVVVSVSAVTLLAIITLTLQTDHPQSETVNFPASLMINATSSFLLVALLTVSTSTAILFQHWFRHGLRIAELKNATIESELNQLKNQINPHFLFNMLNNANVLVKENPQEAAHILSKLNDMLKYQLKETSSDRVLVKDDIRFLTDYLNLEKIRRDNFSFTISTEGITDTLTTPPFLFIPFVENAVKHNNDNKNLSYVHLWFKVRNNELHFTCINSKPTDLPTRQEEGGIGLANISRRLELLYGDRYKLEIDNAEITYTINLYIRL